MTFRKAKKILSKMAGDKMFIIKYENFIDKISDKTHYAVLIAGYGYFFGNTLKEAVDNFIIKYTNARRRPNENTGDNT